MKDPTYLEYQQIAALKNDPGYQLLLTYLKAEIDNYADVLADGCTAIEEQKILGRWRGMRQVYATLAETPEKFAGEARAFREQEEAEKGPQMPSRIQVDKKHLSLSELEALRIAYEQEMNKNKPQV